MIIYNVTCSVDREIADEWISWMKEIHIPGLLKSGLFEGSRILKVLSHDDEHSLSYAVQFYSGSMANVEKYYVNDDIQNRYGERVLTYPTILEEV